MAIVAKRQETERELPEPGLYKAVCVDVVDKGVVVSKISGKPQEKVLIVWELAEAPHPTFDGNFTVAGYYTLSLHEKSNLGQMLDSWRGKAMSDEERDAGFDLETLVGVAAQINVIHSKDGKYANPGAVMPCRESVEPTGQYTRQIDRQEQPKKGYAGPEGAYDKPVKENGFPEDDLPF